MTDRVHAASFRDPSGFMFRAEDGTLLRQVNRCYESEFRMFIESGLYDELVKAGLIVPHEELPLDAGYTDDAYAVLRPRELPFISYPYEWSFGQLKAAALLTLNLHKRALNKGMVLKDASAFNIQFDGAQPIFIDTLSFEPYREGEPWVAYRQFCRHFLAPLALMTYVEPTLNALLRLDVEGVSLNTASRMLPMRTWARAGLLTHVHLHAAAERRYAPTKKNPDGRQDPSKQFRVSRANMTTFIDHLESAVRKVKCPPPKTAWADYYKTDAYAEESASRKAQLVETWIGQSAPRIVWDLGANTGLYSRIAAKSAELIVAMDHDWGCVEAAYRACRKEKSGNILPLRMDLTNPSPAVGWALQERASLVDRGPADVVMALALMHHLAVGNNVPFASLAECFARLGRRLIIEFVPKEDEQVRRLLRSRKDIFTEYTQQAFEQAFAQRFTVLASEQLPESGRVLYLMETH